MPAYGTGAYGAGVYGSGSGDLVEFMPGFYLQVGIAPGADRSEPSISWPWVDITGDVRVDQGVAISAGRRDERGTVPPGSCQLKLDNTSGDYCRTNPLGQWYGLLGKNTPLRVRVTPAAAEVADTFTRTTSGGWGYADGGQPWYTFRSSGSVSDFATTGSAGTHSVQTNVSYRLTYLPTVQLEDAEIVTTVTVAEPTGGVVEPANLLLRGQGETTYYMCRLVIAQTTLAVSATVIRVVDGAETVLGTAGTGLTHAAATPLKARAQIAGETVRIRAWQGGTEPATWALSVTDDVISLPGWVGIRSGVGSGNSNTKPVVFTYDNVEVAGPHDLFVGEVPEWAPRWDPALVDLTVPIAAAGVLRRLSQGASALHSPAYRALTSSADAPYRVAYWPLEEDDGATMLSSPVGSPTPAMSGELTLGGYTDAPATERMIRFGSFGQVTFPVPAYTSTEHKIVALWAVPAAGMAGNRTAMRMHCTGGSLGFIDFTFMSTGSIELEAYNSSGTQVDTYGPIGFAVNGEDCMISLEFTESGGDVDVRVFVQKVGGGLGTFADDTWPGQSIGRIFNIGMGQFDLDGVAVGHLAVGSDTAQAFEAFLVASNGTPPGVGGYSGETVATRLERLSAEEGFPILVAAGDTVGLGPQPAATLLTIAREGEAADHGVLYEFGSGLAYQPLSARYLAVDGAQGAEVVLTLDCEAGEVAPPEPVDDDQALVNDVTVARRGGGRARYEATGQFAPGGPTGRYDPGQVTLNLDRDDDLVQHASLLVARGTVDDLRWPAIPLVLHGRAALALRWLGTGVGSRLQLVNPPPGVGPGPVDLFLEGWSCRIGWNFWAVEANCSPASPYRVAILDGSGNAARLETSGAELGSAVSTSATTWTVTTTDGPVSITTASHPGDFPFDVECEGEQVTVTAVTGASSPQTFTVTRAVNGVSKAHAAGAGVRLWQPYWPGL